MTGATKSDNNGNSSQSIACFAAGCFWGVEETFRKLPGVLMTKVGYTGGQSKDPSYEEVCQGNTGHAEAVRIEFDPSIISFSKLLDTFWSAHDPSTKNRQGLDIGSQYRSAVFYTSSEQQNLAIESKRRYDELATAQGSTGLSCTEIEKLDIFYLAEDYHQSYVQKHNAKKCRG